MKRMMALFAMLLLAAFGAPGAVQAQSGNAVANYASGWNMIGGPPGTDFSKAGALYAYTGAGYITPAGSQAALCQGYWALFTDPTTITLPASNGTGPQTCPLRAGWNLLGNPFAGAAQLPSDVTAYHWNPSTDLYEIVHVIPPGGAVWIDSPGPGAITLQFVPAVTPASSELTISDLTTSGPYRVHVGDTVKLVLSSGIGYTATTDAAHLHLESAGFSGPLSCLNDPACAVSLVNQFWIWRAVQPGQTVINVAQVCAQTSTACSGVVQRIEIDILP